MLTSDFLREIAGFVAKSRTVQGAMMESVYFWIFLSPGSRTQVETEFTTLRSRLRRAIRVARDDWEEHDETSEADL